MERVRGAGAVLAVLVVLGAPPAAGEELSGVFQFMGKSECHFINGTERVRLVARYIYNREQFVHFDSDVGVYVGDTPFGESWARYFNSIPGKLEYRRSAVDRLCRHNYDGFTPFLVNRRGERGAERVPSAPAPGMTPEPLKPSLGITPDPSALPVPLLSPSVSISLVPSSSQPGPGRLLCSVMDFYPAPVQVRWFQDGQELPEHVVATDVIPNGDWSCQVLVMLEIPPGAGSPTAARWSTSAWSTP
ncbi:class II histocompatibility antigen, B-L beta chain-like [Pseudopipra pipra]|uniref:class II histocompatibility antigen, B-L beta chain-like n=1 Tax=Pseudopipra pipra TaxID=415032 RepID=UPI0031395EB2